MGQHGLPEQHRRRSAQMTASERCLEQRGAAQSRDSAFVIGVHRDTLVLTHAVCAGGEQYVYQSCTQSATHDGAMDGSFWFVPGSLEAPTGPGFPARVRAFVCFGFIWTMLIEVQANLWSSCDVLQSASQPCAVSCHQCLAQGLSTCFAACALQDDDSGLAHNQLSC